MEFSPTVSCPQVPEADKITCGSPLARMQFSVVFKFARATIHSFLSEVLDFLLYSTFSGHVPFLVQ